jgi:hypothetical protein
MAYLAQPMLDRFFDKLSLDENGCWIWNASKERGGYGQFWVGSKREKTWRRRKAHRVAYEAFRGEIPADRELDHLCRVRECVNPWHLEVVTHRENCLRGNAPTAIWHRADTCKRGHSLLDAYTQGGRRVCRQCKVLYERRRRAEKKALA